MITKVVIYLKGEVWNQGGEFKMKNNYLKIAKAIYKKAINNDEARDLIRMWIGLFEESGITNWSRDKFLDACIMARRKYGKY